MDWKAAETSFPLQCTIKLFSCKSAKPNEYNACELRSLSCMFAFNQEEAAKSGRNSEDKFGGNHCLCSTNAAYIMFSVATDKWSRDNNDLCLINLNSFYVFLCVCVFLICKLKFVSISFFFFTTLSDIQYRYYSVEKVVNSYRVGCTVAT